MHSNQKRYMAQAVARFEAEALRLAGRVSANQLRFLLVAKTKGKELEPAGPLAGVPDPRR
ncbi:hypothetical protein ACI2KG_25000 [Pseudomonas sp. NPDC089407]|uniref:hypothetical protein n=1 Tax=Pseudomonas sp. NPDC089407 TaxID=3364464 RepID=UPI00385025F5